MTIPDTQAIKACLIPNYQTGLFVGRMLAALSSYEQG